MRRRNFENKSALPERYADTSVGEFVILSVIVFGFLLALFVLAYFV